MFGYVSFRNICFLSNIESFSGNVDVYRKTVFCVTLCLTLCNQHITSFAQHMFTYIVDYISLKYIILSLNCCYFIIIFSCVV